MECFEFYGGIDWGCSHHQACITAAKGEVLREVCFENSLGAIHDFVEELAKLTTPESTVLGIETKDHVLISVLRSRGFEVLHLNPKQSDRFRDRFAPSGRKSDELDAQVLASAVRTDRQCFHPIEDWDPALFRIARMVALRDRLADQGEACLNRVFNELSRTFPDLLGVGSLYRRVWVRQLVRAFPVPSMARKATAAELAQILPPNGNVDEAAILTQLRSARSWLPVEIETIIAQDIVTELDCAERYVREVGRLYREIDREMKGRAMAQSDEHPSDEAIIQSIPGIGAVTSALIATQASAAVEQRDCQKLRALAGTAPVTKKSGKQGRGRGPKPKVTMRRACRRDLRNALHHAASTNIQRDPRSKAYYARQRARGHTHAAALRRVADQLIRLLMVLLTRRVLYDPARRLVSKVPSSAPLGLTEA